MTGKKFKAYRLLQFQIFIRQQLHAHLLKILTENKGELLKGLQQDVHFNPNQYSDPAESANAWKAAELVASFVLGAAGSDDVSGLDAKCMQAIDDSVERVLNSPEKLNERLLYIFISMKGFLPLLLQFSLTSRSVLEILVEPDVDLYADKARADTLMIAVLRHGAHQYRTQEFIQGVATAVLIEAFLDFGTDSDRRIPYHQYLVLQSRFIQLAFSKLFS